MKHRCFGKSHMVQNEASCDDEYLFKRKCLGEFGIKVNLAFLFFMKLYNLFYEKSRSFSSSREKKKSRDEVIEKQIYDMIIRMLSRYALI